MNKREDIAGICPACGEIVRHDEPDGPIWTCPSDLNPENGWYKPPLEPIASWDDAKREKEGYFGLCNEDIGEPCHKRLPLHSDCYEKGDY